MEQNYPSNLGIGVIFQSGNRSFSQCIKLVDYGKSQIAGLLTGAGHCEDEILTTWYVLSTVSAVP